MGSPFRGEAFRNSPTRHSPPPSTPGTSKTVGNLNPTVLPPPSPPKNVSESAEPALQLLETATFMNQLPPEMFGKSVS